MKSLLLVLSFLFVSLGQARAADAKRPNLIIILADDLGETKNLAAEQLERVARMKALYAKLIADSRSTPGAPQKNDVKVVRHPQATAGKKKGAAKKQPAP